MSDGQEFVKQEAPVRTRIRISLLALVTVVMSSLSVAGDQQPPASAATGSIDIIDDAALALIDPTSDLLIRSDGYKWTEGPVWIEDGGYLLFSDIPNNVIMKYQPEAGVSVFLRKAGATGLFAGDDMGGSNGLLLDRDGRLVLFQQGDRRVAAMDASLSEPAPRFTTLAGRYGGKRLNSPNDGVYHSDGSLYFTDPPYGLEKALDDPRKELPYQGIYRLDTEGTLELLDDSVSFPNGIAFTKDEKTLVVAVSDQEHPLWLAFDVQADGTLSNKRVFYDAIDLLGRDGEQGMPDGMAVHSSGILFATGPGGVWLFTPEGDVLAKIRTGRLTANCTLSDDEKTLFITAHDTLMTLPLK